MKKKPPAVAAVAERRRRRRRRRQRSRTERPRRWWWLWWWLLLLKKKKKNSRLQFWPLLLRGGPIGDVVSISSTSTSTSTSTSSTSTSTSTSGGFFLGGDARGPRRGQPQRRRETRVEPREGRLLDARQHHFGLAPGEAERRHQVRHLAGRVRVREPHIVIVHLSVCRLLKLVLPSSPALPVPPAPPSVISGGLLVLLFFFFFFFYYSSSAAGGGKCRRARRWSGRR